MKSGQSLVVLLVFAAVTITITSAAATVAIVNSTTSSRVEQGEIAYNAAEAGVENALIRLLRDPAYVGETLTVDDALATINVSGDNPYTVTVAGSYENFMRRLQITAEFTDGVMSITSWREVY